MCRSTSRRGRWWITKAMTASNARGAERPWLGASTGRRPMALAHLQPPPAGLGEVHRVQAAGNDEPIPFNRAGAAGRVGFDRAQVAEGLPSLRLAAGRIIKLAHDANRRLLDRANLWRASSASSALRCCALRHRGFQGTSATRSRAAKLPCDRLPARLADHQRWSRRMSPSWCGSRSQSRQ
jgi:hypothetical protein